ncbi:MAG TPA: hypothetical protein PK847_02535 [Candidatus Sumerlaeota bacterium]|nr:hypothetical protein [Candidatus Sumerlaeota bacterium]
MRQQARRWWRIGWVWVALLALALSDGLTTAQQPPPFPPPGQGPPMGGPPGGGGRWRFRGGDPGGFPPPGPGFAREAGPIQTPQELATLLTRLDDLRNRFDQVERERTRLMDELNARRGDARADHLTPAGLLERQTIERLLADVTARVEEGNHLVRQAAFMTGRLMRQRHRWESWLTPPQPALGGGAQRLTDALAALRAEGEAGFCRALLGDPLGQLAAGALTAVAPPWYRPADELTSPTEAFEEGELPPLPPPGWGQGRNLRPLPGGMRRRLHERLLRMEQRQEEITAMLNQQAVEIERLRLILEQLPETPELE